MKTLRDALFCVILVLLIARLAIPLAGVAYGILHGLHYVP